MISERNGRHTVSAQHVTSYISQAGRAVAAPFSNILPPHQVNCNLLPSKGTEGIHIPVRVHTPKAQASVGQT